MPQYYCLMWWNVENLFDIENSPRRTDKLQRTLQKELKGWTESILAKKIAQLAKIISKVNGNNGPDVLGICEVENRYVVEKLRDSLAGLPHNYQIIHADTQDNRGIDVAFIYDADKFETKPEEVFFHTIVKRVATREIVQVNFKSKASGEYLVLVGNHWPSRSSGQLESEPYRMMAGETLSYFNQRIQEELGENTAVLAMGDFNDEPFNRSITEYALGTVSQKNVENARDAPRLLNAMWPIMASGNGTFYYDGSFNLLDQFMLSKGFLIPERKFTLQQQDNGRSSGIEIISFPEMENTVGAPIAFSRPSTKGGVNLTGFSDHFPISLMINEG